RGLRTRREVGVLSPWRHHCRYVPLRVVLGEIDDPLQDFVVAEDPVDHLAYCDLRFRFPGDPYRVSDPHDARLDDTHVRARALCAVKAFGPALLAHPTAESATRNPWRRHLQDDIADLPLLRERGIVDVEAL